MKLNFKEVAKPAAILFAICIIVSAALAGTNALTADRIAQQNELNAEASRKLVLQNAETFEEQSTADGAYHVGMARGEVVGYVFETAAKGYGGDVKVMTGISSSGEITGVVILEHGETPGLGANAVKEDFREQFNQAVPTNAIQVVKYQTPSEGQIEAMTGATITSTAVTNAVNQAIDRYHQVGGN